MSVIRRLRRGVALLSVMVGPQVAAQGVPARDLWDFPIGALADAPALAGSAGGALYNPASPLIGGTAGRAAFGITALSASADQGVEGQLAHSTWFRAGGQAITVSLGRAAVGGIIRTGTDPQGLGSVAYQSWVSSLSLSRAVSRHLLVGAAARYRTGRADDVTGRSIAADIGVVGQHLTPLDLRIGLASFLWRPGREIEDRSGASMALDGRVLGRSDLRGVRLGYSAQWARRGAREGFLYARARYSVLELVGGTTQTRRFGESNTRARFGVTFHFARYSAGIAREDGVSRLAPTYQFSLTSLLP
jgi:hypothetical protein